MWSSAAQRSRRLILALILIAIPSAAEAVDGTDLSVGWIARLPKIDYVWASSNPTVEGWPAVGEHVTWRAHVRNLSNRNFNAVGYRWLLDGEVTKSGSVNLSRGAHVTLDLDWTWTFDRHEVVFEIDPNDVIAEIEERNNDLLIYTDALGIGFYVEQAFWDSIRDNLVRADIGATSFDDWVQIQVRRFNEMAAAAIYPETPDGVLDRWRIDEIHLVPDGTLPLVPPGDAVVDWGGPASNYSILYPDSSDRTIDMQWGFPAFTAPWFEDFDMWAFTIGNSLVHELGHARYLIDVYACDVASPDVVDLDPPPPSTEYGVFHKATLPGLMATQWGFLDRSSAAALNRIAGHRATVGNYNEPANLGEFLDELPAENRVRFVTPDGETFPNADVKIYRASSDEDPDWESHIYNLRFDSTPDLELQTDEDGAVLVGRNPFSTDGIFAYVNRVNIVAIVEILDGSDRHWGYLESLQFNLAYWRGETELAEHTLLVDAPVCYDGLGRSTTQPRPEEFVKTHDITFQWPWREGHKYEFWYSVDGERPKRIVLDHPEVLYHYRVIHTMSFRGKRISWWYVDHDPVSGCPPVHSSVYGFELDPSAWALERVRPVRRD